MWPIQLVLLLFIVCRIFLSSLTRHYSYFHSRSIQLIFSIFLQQHILKNFRGISDLLVKVSKFQYDAKLCSKYSTSIVCSLNLSSICWWKEPSCCWMLLLPRQLMRHVAENITYMKRVQVNVEFRLRGCLATLTWLILRVQVNETASRYGRRHKRVIYWINSRR